MSVVGGVCVEAPTKERQKRTKREREIRYLCWTFMGLRIYLINII